MLAEQDEELEYDPPQMVLQRNQVSVSNFLNNGTVFGLTIVCAVLGVAFNQSSEPTEGHDHQQVIRTQ